MIDMVELLTDPDFTTEFSFNISSGILHDNGKYTEQLDCKKMMGVIQPAQSKETQFLKDGDKYRQAIKIWSAEYMSAADKREPQLGDIIEWHCNPYRIVSVKDWSDYGYWQAMAVQLTGSEYE